MLEKPKLTKGELKVIALIKSGKDFNAQINGCFFYCIDGWYYRLKNINKPAEQWNGERWVEC